MNTKKHHNSLSTTCHRGQLGDDRLDMAPGATELLERIRSALRSRGPDAVKLLTRRSVPIWADLGLGRPWRRRQNPPRLVILDILWYEKWKYIKYQQALSLSVRKYHGANPPAFLKISERSWETLLDSYGSRRILDLPSVVQKKWWEIFRNYGSRLGSLW